MQLDHKAFKSLICGKSGSGKTTYFCRFIYSCDYPKIFIYDHEGEFAIRTGQPPCITPEQLENSIGQKYTIFDPSELFPGNIQGGFDFFCEWTFKMCEHIGGKKLFCCDELQKLNDPNSIAYELSMVLETGRRYGLDTLMIAQQANLVHNRVRHQLTEIVAFCAFEKNAIDRLVDWGFDENQIKSLAMGQYVCLDLVEGKFTTGKVF